MKAPSDLPESDDTDTSVQREQIDEIPMNQDIEILAQRDEQQSTSDST